MDERIKRLADLITQQGLEQHKADYLRHYSPDYPETIEQMHRQSHTATIHPGLKYTRIDVGLECHRSGRYMIDERGDIYGIKAYGVIHRGHWFGTLDTIDNYNWGGYRAVRKDAKPRQMIHAAPTRPANIIAFRQGEEMTLDEATQLEIGRNYYTVFGDSGSQRKLIYNGGHSWTASNGDQTQTSDSPATTAKVLAYVGRASYHMGTIGR